jgi:hypothetical protein
MADDDNKPKVIPLEPHRKRRSDRNPPPDIPRAGAAAGKWTPNELGLPVEDSCPVQPIGFDGDKFYVIDAAGQFRGLTANQFNQAGIQDLFAPLDNFPKWAWPRYGKPPMKAGKPIGPAPIKSFQADDVKEALFGACRELGQFSPTDRVRGRGAWALRNGQLIYHAGNKLWSYDAEAEKFLTLQVGFVDEMLYPRMPELPAPYTGPIGLELRQRTVGAFFETLRKWNWERPAVDPVLLLGWIGVGYLGGALDWRSAALLLGDKGSGKSTLQEKIREIYGTALFHSADTTAAGIYQQMRHDARPVALDELEPDFDSYRSRAAIQLMRDASSGAIGRRGGSDGTASQFTMRSAFLFSAINNPIQRSQDLSRVAILRLRALDASQTKPPPILADDCGPVCLARCMSQWHKFPALLQAYSQALGRAGHDGRGQMTYGTLLTCAEMLLGPELGAILEVPLSENLDFWAEHLHVDYLPEVGDAMQNWRACAMHLLTVPVPMWRNGARTTIGQLVADLEKGSDDFNQHHAKKELAHAGLGLCLPGEVAPYEYGYVLAIPNSSPAVGVLYERTQWQCLDGGAGGPWKDAMRQAPDGVVLQNNYRPRIGGFQGRCTFLVLKHFAAECAR